MLGGMDCDHRKTGTFLKSVIPSDSFSYWYPVASLCVMHIIPRWGLTTWDIEIGMIENHFNLLYIFNSTYIINNRGNKKGFFNVKLQPLL